MADGADACWCTTACSGAARTAGSPAGCASAWRRCWRTASTCSPTTCRWTRIPSWATTRSSGLRLGLRPTPASATRIWASSARRRRPHAAALAARCRPAGPRAGGAAGRRPAAAARGLVHRWRAGPTSRPPSRRAPTPSSPARSPSRRPTGARDRRGLPGLRPPRHRALRRAGVAAPLAAALRPGAPLHRHRTTPHDRRARIRGDPSVTAAPADDGRRRGIGPEIMPSAVAAGCRRRRWWWATWRCCAARCSTAPAASAGGAAGRPGRRARTPAGCAAVWQPPGLPAGLAEPLGAWSMRRAGAAAARVHRCGRGAGAAGRGPAIVTAPIHKEALAAAGSPSRATPRCCRPLAGGMPVRMMLANDELRVVLVTIHLALRAPSTHRQTRCSRPAHHPPRAAAWARRPRIAVAGLNPHAGEGGLFGDEEIDLIAPAIAAARAEGIDAQRPVRARHGVHAGAAAAGEFDVVVAMTHDHGPDPGQVPGRGAGRERDAGPAVRAHQPRPRHRVRHRRHAARPTRPACWRL
jgi:4-hydroxythreonine-4-phosphate dehydrogenase